MHVFISLLVVTTLAQGIPSGPCSLSPQSTRKGHSARTLERMAPDHEASKEFARTSLLLTVAPQLLTLLIQFDLELSKCSSPPLRLRVISIDLSVVKMVFNLVRLFIVWSGPLE